MTVHVSSWVSEGLTASARCWPNSRVAGDLGHIGAHVTLLLCIPIHMGLLNILSLYSCRRTHSIKQSINQSINHRITHKTALGNQRET